MNMGGFLENTVDKETLSFGIGNASSRYPFKRYGCVFVCLLIGILFYIISGSYLSDVSSNLDETVKVDLDGVDERLTIVINTFRRHDMMEGESKMLDDQQSFLNFICFLFYVFRCN